MSLTMPDLDEFDASLITLGKKEERKWDFTDGDGKATKGSKNVAPLESKDPKTGKTIKPMVVLQNVTVLGVRVNKNKASIGLSISKEMGELIRERVDIPLQKLILEHKATYANKPEKLKSLDVLDALFTGLAKEGGPKKDKPSERWNPTINLELPLTKSQKQFVPASSVKIIDAKATPYSWTNLEGQKLKELGIQLDEIHYSTNDKIRLQASPRLIVVDDETAPPVCTKRLRFEQPEVADQSSNPSASTTGAATQGNVGGATADAPVSADSVPGAKRARKN